jgi:hypothetical protein
MRTLTLSLAVIASATIHAQSPSPTFPRGELVRVLPTPSVPNSTTLVLRVVAIPNDRIRIDKSAIYVNDVQVTGFSAECVANVVRAAEPLPKVVPDGHYFVMGERRVNEDISEYWGQHPGIRLERAR